MAEANLLGFCQGKHHREALTSYVNDPFETAPVVISQQGFAPCATPLVTLTNSFEPVRKEASVVEGVTNLRALIQVSHVPLLSEIKVEVRHKSFSNSLVVLKLGAMTNKTSSYCIWQVLWGITNRICRRHGPAESCLLCWIFPQVIPIALPCHPLEGSAGQTATATATAHRLRFECLVGSRVP